jgi:hypothetical protein
MDVAAWLQDLGLARYQQAFREHEIDATVLHELTDADLQQLGVSTIGHRKTLLRAIAKLAMRDDGGAERLLASAWEVIASGNNVARLFMLGAIVWWFANLLPFDLSEGAFGTPIKRLGDMKELIKKAEAPCQTAVDQYNNALIDGTFRTCRPAGAGDSSLKKGKELADSIDWIGDALDRSAAKCPDEVAKWRERYFENCLSRKAEISKFIDDVAKQGNLDIAGLKFSNIHPKWHAAALSLIVFSAAIWIGSKRRQFFRVIDQYFYEVASGEIDASKLAAFPRQHAYLPWWLWPIPDWRYGSDQRPLRKLMLTSGERRRLPISFLLVLLMLLLMLISSLNIQRRVSDFQLEDYEQSLAELSKPTFSLTGGMPTDIGLLAAIIAISVSIFCWLPTRVRTASEGSDELCRMEPRALLRQGLTSAGAIVLAATVVPFLVAPRSALDLPGGMPAQRLASASRKPVQIAEHSGEVGWYRYRRSFSQPAWIGHFVRPEARAEHPARPPGSGPGKTTIRPSGTIGGAGALSTVQLERLQPLGIDELPAFEPMSVPEKPRLNLSFYSEGIESVALAAWTSGDHAGAIEVLRTGLTYARVDEDLNLRLYDLLSGLLVRSGREAELDGLIEELSERLGQTRDLRRQLAPVQDPDKRSARILASVPGVRPQYLPTPQVDRQSEILIRRLKSRIERWDERDGKWRRAWRSGQRRRWSRIDI